MQVLVDYVLLICRMQKARPLLQVYSCLICYSSEANCRLAEKPCLAAFFAKCLVQLQSGLFIYRLLAQHLFCLMLLRQISPMIWNAPTTFMALSCMFDTACNESQRLLDSYLLQARATILSDSAMLPSFPPVHTCSHRPCIMLMCRSHQ